MTGAISFCPQGASLSDRRSHPEPSFGQLIESARRGDENALAELIDSCRNYLLLVANQDLPSEIRSKLGASDVVQEAMLSAHRDFGRFDGATQSDFLAWIRGILKNDLLETRRYYHGAEKRKIGRESPIDDSRQIGATLRDAAVTPGTNAVRNEQAERLNESMTQLSSEHRQVIELRNWQQLSFSEIGARMNRSENAARKLWARAVQQLQTAMKDCRLP